MAMCLHSCLGGWAVFVAHKVVVRIATIITVVIVVIIVIASIVHVLVAIVCRVLVINVIAEGGLAVRLLLQRIRTQLDQLWDLLDGARQVDGILQEVVLFQVRAQHDVLLSLAVVIDLRLRGLVVVVVG